jgi:carboxyl-terminal processing protease
VIASVVAIAVVVGVGSFVAGARYERGAVPEGFEEILRTADDIRENAVEPVSDAELVQAAIRGMLSVLDDPYAAYLGPGEASELQELLDGSMVGLGVWLEVGRGGLRVSSVMEASPADEAGILPGDVLLAVDGQPLDGVTLKEGGRLLSGEEGTTVRLRVRREGQELEVDVSRAPLAPGAVQARMVEGAAYAHPLHFAEGTTESLRRELEAMLDDGARGIVLDLRGNPGGLAEEAYATAGLFLEDGVVARIEDRDGNEQVIEAEGATLPPVPVVVVVDGGTASAAELVAGALQDRDRGTLVGTQTYGKGAIVSLASLGGEGSVQFSTARFLTPDGRPVEGRGIVPDVPVLPGGPADAQLQRALRVLGDRE